MRRLVTPFLYLLIAGLAGCHSSAGLRIGSELPSMTLADVHGKPMTLPNDVKGKVAMIRFWSISCPSCCKELLKSFEGLYQKYKDRGFIAVAINVDPPAEADEEFRQLAYVHYPLLVDPGWTAAKNLGIHSLPMTFILDEKGIVREKISGDAPPEFFEQLMTQVLYRSSFHDLPMQMR